MNKLISVFLCFVTMLLAVSAHAFGLGDSVKDIRSQYGSKVSLDDTYYVFGKPPRASRIDIESSKFFGTVPATAIFIKGIKPLLPPDAKLTAAYSKPALQKEIYIFRAASLTKLPNIKDAVLDSPPGTFTVYVNYDGSRIINCAISMGLPGDVDLSGTKKISKNPFK